MPAHGAGWVVIDLSCPEIKHVFEKKNTLEHKEKKCKTKKKTKKGWKMNVRMNANLT